jgi:arsenate reductase
MRLSLGKRQKDKDERTILFVCVQNAGRSQMAEGFFRKYSSRNHEAISAGTLPTTVINPVAVEAMREKGIDISNQRPKELTEDMMKNATKIINMGCMDKNFCPTLFVPRVIDWGIEDPKGKPMEKVREIRDEIEKRVFEVINELDTNTEITSKT